MDRALIQKYIGFVEEKNSFLFISMPKNLRQLCFKLLRQYIYFSSGDLSSQQQLYISITLYTK